VEAKMKLKEQVAPGMSDILYVITGCGMGYMASMGHPKALGDIIEAAIGAAFVDSDMDLTRVYPVRALAAVLSCLVACQLSCTNGR
jgi:dsRNA-specific ribonuclease